MTARSPSAFALSALLHASVALAVVLVIFCSQQHPPVQPVIFELVAGEGNNYMATEAPALGSSDRPVKFSIAKIKPAPLSSTPKTIETAPPQPVSVQLPDFTKTLKRVEAPLIKKAKAQAKAEQEAETQRLISKAKFDALHAKSSTPKTASAAPRKIKVPIINSEGIANGVLNGSTVNKTGGASGKALDRQDRSLLDSYKAFVRQQLKAAFDAVKPTGLSDQLEADVELHILADGTLAHARIVKSSGSDEFDQAALEAVRHVEPLGARPAGLSEVQTIPFRMTEPDDTN